MPSPIALLILLLLSSSGTPLSESARIFTIMNFCKEKIWAGVTPGHSFDGGGFELNSQQSRTFTAPAGWIGRIWGRTGCEFDKNGQGKCLTGACGESLKCNVSMGKAPLTLAEFSLDGSDSTDYYDVSLVDGFNIPLVVAPTNGKGNCSNTGCDGDLRTNCPPELALKANGNTVACGSACNVFKTDQYCCTGAFANTNTCIPTNYSKIYKEACPTAYSYAYDNPLSVFTCSDADYVINFCSARLDLYPNSPLDSSPPPSPPTIPPNVAIQPSKGSAESGHRRKSYRTVIIVVIILIIFVVPLIAFSYFLFLRTKPKGLAEEGAGDDIITVESLRFDFGTIRAATNDFSEDNKLGQGGFGVVYKGKHANGEAIAVKRLSRDSGQGELEFKNEVLLLAKLAHKNLVRLLGFCFQGKERLLIYELVHNSSLDNYIFDPTECRILDWEKRYKVITGIARGLLYLHDGSRLRIIHRDLKASNILLDEHMNPKIADFGLARLFAEDQTQEDTRRIVGTFGYMPPEYVGRGQFSVKSDVFSFGVLVLEILSGQKISVFLTEEGDSLLTYAWKKWKEGETTNLIDDRLRDGWSSEMMRCVHISLLCVQENAADRPNMATVALMLGGHSITRQVPSKPAFFTNSNIHDHKNHSAPAPSINKVSITDLYPR